MRYDAVLSERVHEQACQFLLRHLRNGRRQEELCFALWRPSTGAERTSALVFELILPTDGERDLHGNASFDASYLSRTVKLVREARAGVGFMHSHFTPGWQDMSREDVAAERERIAPPARALGLPAVGLTLGTDGRWSVRFWVRDGGVFHRRWCDRVRVVGDGLYTTRHPRLAQQVPSRRENLRRTIATWGDAVQAELASLRMGIVGLGSVGAMVAEALARMGVERLVLIDPDRVELHNLDRLLHAGRRDVGRFKVRLAAKQLKRSATAVDFQVNIHPRRIQDPKCYAATLDCDLLFAAVDRPLPKDLLNHIAHAHCIPVIFGGVYAANKANGTLGQAAWSVLTVAPERRCLRCDGQYTTSDVTMERDGSLDRPDYIRDLRNGSPVADGQNVFPFSANLASFMVLEMIRMVVAEDWWPHVGGKMHFSLVPRRLASSGGACKQHCSMHAKLMLGDQASYPFLEDADDRTGGWTRMIPVLKRPGAWNWKG